MSWLTDKLLGYRLLFAGGLPFPERGAMEFVGATVADDPTNKRTTITIPAVSEVAAATHLATPDTLVMRDGVAQANFGGTCNFSTIAASVAITAPAATLTACDVDTLEAATSITSPLFQSSAGGEWVSVAQSAPATNSGACQYGSGAASGAGSSSGVVILSSGDAHTTAGNILVKGGDGTGASGAGAPVVVRSGDSKGAIAAGTVEIQGGDAEDGQGSPVTLTGGGSTGGGLLGGAIRLVPGTGDGGKACVSLGSSSPDPSDSEGAIFVADADAPPTAAPAGGSLFWSDAGDLAYMGVEGVALSLSRLPRVATFTFTHADLTAAAVSETLNFASALPANARIIGWNVKLATAFSGGGAASCSLKLGSSGDIDAILSAADLFAAAVDGQATGTTTGIAPFKHFSVSTTLQVTVTADVNVAGLTAGSCTVEVTYSVLP